VGDAELAGVYTAAKRMERTAPDQIRVAIIEDQREIREGLRFLIDGTAGYRCTGAFASMEEALPAVRPGFADVVLCDIGLPGMSGIDGMRFLKERDPELRLVALTVYEDEDRVFQALCAGASGYLLKNTPPARLLERLQEVMSGGAPLSPEVATSVVALFKQFRPPHQAEYHLTPHEVRLLNLLAEGHSYKTAAATLGSSVNTVAFHMKSIYLKLQVHSKSEAVAKALRRRIVR
jgi:DNA-binding NarL/FixJ family response regulator